MTVITAVRFKTPQGQIKQVDLLHPERPTSGRYETTIITGHNGSHKSTLLKQLVTDLATPASSGKTALNPDKNQVLCISGSVADRFPQKGLPGGTRSAFDVPNYAYVGQRVINNLLSKKAPLETMLGFALARNKAERYRWKFFSDAHTHAGIRPSVKYVLTIRPDKREKQWDVLGALQGKRQGETEPDRSADQVLRHVSPAMARWLLDEFTYDEFLELQNLLSSKKKRRIEFVLDMGGPHCEQVAPNVLRLGLLTDLLRLSDVNVQAAHSAAQFSLLELSSGEYHMFSTILAIGFGLNEKAVLLIDEPENNLHPQWQRDLMATVFDVCSQAMTEGHVIICTHSPLIVGAAREGSTVVDLTRERPRISVVTYGASSDELLLAQFGVGSSRNQVVVDAVQRAVSLVERGDFNNSEFRSLVPGLRSIRNALTSNDPMIDVIDALLDEEPAQ